MVGGAQEGWGGERAHPATSSTLQHARRAANGSAGVECGTHR